VYCCGDGAFRNDDASADLALLAVEQVVPIRRSSRDRAQVDLHGYVAPTTGRRFHNHLAARGVLFDSFAMEVGRQALTRSSSASQDWSRRRQTDIVAVAALVHPEQVKSRMLNSPLCLEYVTSPRVKPATTARHHARGHGNPSCSR
jgi:hypothetical protein